MKNTLTSVLFAGMEKIQINAGKYRAEQMCKRDTKIKTMLQNWWWQSRIRGSADG